MLIFVDENEQDFVDAEYEFAYKDRNNEIEKVVLNTDYVDDCYTVTIVDSDYSSEVEIFISDIPKLIKALEAAHSKAVELRKN